MTTHNDSWEKELEKVEEEYPMAIENWDTQDWKNYVRKQVAAAEKRKVAEIVEKVREFYEQNKNDYDGVAQDFSEGWDAGLESLLRILSHLQAEDQKHD